jgi:hypothetical protein
MLPNFLVGEAFIWKTIRSWVSLVYTIACRQKSVGS